MSRKRIMIWIFFYGALGILGAFMAYHAYNQYQETKSLLANGIKTTATVTAFDTHQSDGSTMYTPIFEYTDKSLTVQTYKSGISSSPPAYSIGDKVKIVYDRADADDVKTISFWGLYRWSVILFMIASPLLVIGGSYLLYALS